MKLFHGLCCASIPLSPRGKEKKREKETDNNNTSTLFSAGNNTEPVVATNLPVVVHPSKPRQINWRSNMTTVPEDRILPYDPDRIYGSSSVENVAPVTTTTASPKVTFAKKLANVTTVRTLYSRTTITNPTTAVAEEMPSDDDEQSSDKDSRIDRAAVVPLHHQTHARQAPRSILKKTPQPRPETPRSEDFCPADPETSEDNDLNVFFSDDPSSSDSE